MDFRRRLEQREWRQSLPPFWSDDFDMDLLKVIPDIQEILGDTADVPIWTVSSTTHGRLNCPSMWNGLGSILWLEKPNLPRDKHGWASISGYVTNSPEVEGTWLEWLRDMWAHGHGWVVMPVCVRFAPVNYHDVFYPIMSHTRAWHQDPHIDRRYRSARLWVSKATRRFRACRPGGAIITGNHMREEQGRQGS